MEAPKTTCFVAQLPLGRKMTAGTRHQVLALYRRIVRESRRLEPDARQYYMRFARSVRLFSSLSLLQTAGCVLYMPTERSLILLHGIFIKLQGFVGHSDETDPERIQEIVARVEQDMEWILNKYTGSGLQTPPVHSPEEQQ